MKALYYRFWWAIAAFLVWVHTRRIVEGVENVPREGPLIMVSNHVNNADPPTLTVSIPRVVSWLVKIEWFANPVLSRLFHWGRAIPIDRYGADLKGLRLCLEALKSGETLGVFPEGTRSKETGALQEFEPGAAFLALKTGARLQPAAIWGSENMNILSLIPATPLVLVLKIVGLQRRLGLYTLVHVRFGKPFTLEAENRKKVKEEEVKRGTLTIAKAVVDLLPAPHHGVYSSLAE